MIRVAVIGAGHWGPNLIRNFHSLQSSRVLCVADRDEERLRLVAERLPDVEVTSNVARVLENPEIEAVVIATPTVTHAELTKAALENGKHVLVEKPITDSTEEGQQLCDLAARSGLVLMVGHVFVHNPAVQEVRARLNAGELGRVHYVSCVRTNLGPIRIDVNAAWDLASQDVSIVNYWLDSPPLTASAVGGSWVNPGVEDAVFITLRYPQDILTHIHVSWLNPRKIRDITVVGEKKMLTYDDMHAAEPLRIYDKRVTDQQTQVDYVDTLASFRASICEGSIVIPRVAMGEPLKNECQHFLQCISEGRPPLTGGPEGVGVVRVLTAIQRSMAQGGREEKV
ncbi:Gfo/Idh/MocA family protein [Planctomycetota bacterium]